MLLPVLDHFLYSFVCLFFSWFTLSNYFNTLLTMWLQCVQICVSVFYEQLHTHTHTTLEERMKKSEMSNIGVECIHDLFTWVIESHIKWKKKIQYIKMNGLFIFIWFILFSSSFVLKWCVNITKILKTRWIESERKLKMDKKKLGTHIIQITSSKVGQL